MKYFLLLNFVFITNLFVAAQNEQDTIAQSEISSCTGKRHSFGIHIGVGTAILTNGLERNLTMPFLIEIGETMYFNKNIVFDYDALIGIQKAKKDFYNAEYTLRNDSSNKFGILNFSLGYNFTNKKNYKIYPFAGLGFMSFYRQFTIGQINATMNGPYMFQPSIGICTDYLFSENTDSKRRRSFTYVKAKLTYFPVNYLGELKGDLISLTFSIGLI